jgi:hypothetical protein
MLWTSSAGFGGWLFPGPPNGSQCAVGLTVLAARLNAESGVGLSTILHDGPQWWLSEPVLRFSREAGIPLFGGCWRHPLDERMVELPVAAAKISAKNWIRDGEGTKTDLVSGTRDVLKVGKKLRKLAAAPDEAIWERLQTIQIIAGHNLPLEMTELGAFDKPLVMVFDMPEHQPHPPPEQLKDFEGAISDSVPSQEAAEKLALAQDEFECLRSRRRAFGPRQPANFERCVIRDLFASANGAPHVGLNTPGGRLLIENCDYLRPHAHLLLLVRLFGLRTVTAVILGFAVTPSGDRVPILQGAPTGRDYQYACLGLRRPVRREVVAAFAGEPDLAWEDRYGELGDLSGLGALAGNIDGNWDAILKRAVLPSEVPRRRFLRPQFMSGSGLILWQGPDGRFRIAKAASPRATARWKQVLCSWFIGRRFAPPGVVFPWMRGETCGEMVRCRRRPTTDARAILVKLIPESDDLVELRELVAEAGLGEGALAVGIAYRLAVVAHGHPPGQIALAGLAHVGTHAVRPHLDALVAIAPHLFADRVLSRREELEILMADQGEEWTHVVETVDAMHCREGRDRVMLELASVCLLGDWMPQAGEVAGRCGLEVELVTGHMRALRAGFEWLPHEQDASQREIDPLYGRRPFWHERMRMLRIRFRDHTQFIIAREFMVGLAFVGVLPSDRSFGIAKRVSARKVAANRAHVEQVADDIFAAMRLEWQAEMERREVERGAMQFLGGRLG